MFCWLLFCCIVLICWLLVLVVRFGVVRCVWGILLIICCSMLCCCCFCGIECVLLLVGEWLVCLVDYCWLVIVSWWFLYCYLVVWLFWFCLGEILCWIVWIVRCWSSGWCIRCWVGRLCWWCVWVLVFVMFVLLCFVVVGRSGLVVCGVVVFWSCCCVWDVLLCVLVCCFICWLWWCGWCRW